MSYCPHCQHSLATPATAGGVCPHCGGVLALDDSGLAGKQTFELFPDSTSDNVLDDIELSFEEDDADATLPFGRTVEILPPSVDNIDVEETASAKDNDHSTVDFIEPEVTDSSDATVESVVYDLDAKDDGPSQGDPSKDNTLKGDTWKEGDPTSTVDFVADKTIEFGPSPTSAEKNGATIDFDSDKTVDLSTTHPELAAKLSSQWAGTIDLATPQHQTIRQMESGEQPTQRSTVPVKSRTLSPAPTGDVSYIRPSDAPDYELLRQIGEGGMGVVYAARQSSIARTVAVKMLKPGAKVGADQRDKFISEAVVTGELDHPNIVPIYDLGSNDQGALFYSMKHVQGTPWEDVLYKKSLDENLNILLRVADAVAFAHARGVVHRDLKPENVMLGEFGEVLVMDWGLARVTQQFPSAKSIYQAGSLGGTPAYMSPEMARGPVEKIDHTSDIYLLGAILYEIIGGRPPHSGRDVMQCLMAAAQNTLDPIEYLGELKDVALKAMATEQRDRYQSVKDFQAAVRTYLSHSESLVLASHAEQRLKEAREKKDYQLFARSLYGFGESLSLWPDNVKARKLLTETELEYAGIALANDDLDLADSLLDKSKEEHTELVTRVRKAQRERYKRQSLLKWTKRAVAALLVAIVGLGTYSYVEIARGRREALTQRDKAQEQEKIAKANEQLAAENEVKATANAEEARLQEVEAKKQAEIAVANEREAIRQKAEAEKQEALANENRQKAEQNAEAARAAEREALIARDREAYEAYIAGIGLAAAKIDENAYDFARELLDASPAERRNWEWGRLGYLCQLSEAVYNYAAPLDAVAYSPDGKLIATGDREGKLTLRDAATGDVTFATPLGQYVYSVAFSPNGKLVAAGVSDGKVQVFRTTGGEPIRTLEGHTDGVLDVDFSPDSKQLVSSSYDNTARVWDLERGVSTDTLAGHSWWVWAAQFAPDGKAIVTASQDSSAIVWRRDATGQYEPVVRFTDHDGPVYTAAFSPSGDEVASAGYDKTIRVWSPDRVGQVDLVAQLSEDEAPETSDAVLTGHTAAVRSVAFGPGGETLLSGGHDNTLRLWNLENERELKTLRGHGSRVESVAVSADGSAAASASQDGTLRVWDIMGYAESQSLGSRTLAGHNDAVLAARFTGDGHVITASRDRTARLWDDEGKEVAEFSEGHEYLASAAEFFANGQRLVTGAGDNTVRLWDAASGAELREFRGTGRVGAVGVDPDGRLLVTGGRNNVAQIWDLATGERLAELKGHEAEVTTATFHQDGKLFATGDDRGEIRVWQLTDAAPELIASFTGHNRSITGLEFAPTGTTLYSSSGDNTCGQWDVASGNEVADGVLAHPDWVAAMDLSSDGRLMLTACEDGKVRVWDLATRQVIAEATLDMGSATGVALSHDGQRCLVTSSENQSVWLWDWNADRQTNLADTRPIVETKAAGTLWTARFTPDGQRILTIGGNDARIVDLENDRVMLRFSPHGAVAAIAATDDGKLVATGSWDGTAKLWDVATQRSVRQLVGGHTGYINSIDFSPDGSMVATASDDGTVRLWKTTSGELLPAVIDGHTGSVHTVRFSPDGMQLLTTGSDRTARLWDALTGHPLQTFSGHDWAVLCGEFSGDGKRIATGGRDNTARVWDCNSGELLATMSGHTSAVTGVALSPDGARLLTASQDVTAKLWDMSTGDEILTLAGHTQDLTAVDFSPTGGTALSASRDGTAMLWPTIDWRAKDASDAR
ncbi:protein kinase domain-containing protein [Aeoliella sp. SH292]|uniref:WD40 repeat domain-containing serine/threonine protein kinase n=1 Tax=Aeoliella sp. SH292 TaxID=3454464 RepID=UPI003F9DEB0A